MSTYPIDPYLDAIAAALKASPFVLLKAEPGAGKSTRAPLSLLTHFKKVLVVQPRRLAARLAASWVATQSGEPLGQLVGYQIRLEKQLTAATRLLFVTEGVFTRKLLQDPQLKEFDLVILDEFHERHLQTDLALAILRAISLQRKELRVLVMSATLELGPLQSYLGEVPSFDVPGRSFPIVVEYHPGGPNQKLEDEVSVAVHKMLEDPRCKGNILVFLSGMSEIYSCRERLERTLSSAIDIVPLTAELAGQYDRLFRDEGRRKLILSTNVAETSVTLPRVEGVIDTGWAKISGYAPWSGLPTLERQRISQASAIQRAGRAGRVAPGVCYRLYSQSEFNSRPLFTKPEIQRIDLSQMLLEIQVIFSGVPRAWEELPWFESPEDLHIKQSRELLEHLEAFDSSGNLCPDAKEMAGLPLHPRLARLVLAGKREGQGAICLLAALLINEEGVLRRDEWRREQGLCDVCYQLGLLLQGSPLLDRNKSQRIRQLYDSLRPGLRLPSWSSLGSSFDELMVRRAIFLAFADRIAKFRPMAERGGRGLRHFNFCQGRGGVLGERSIVRESEWLVAVDARETLSADPQERTRIETSTAIDPSWLELDPFELRRQTLEISFDEKSGRVRKIKQELYGKLLISESVEQADGGELSAHLAAVVSERWPDSIQNVSELRAYHHKLAILDRNKVEHNMPQFAGDYLELLILHLCEGAHSLSEVHAKDLRQAIEDQLDYSDLVHLRELCPDTVLLQNGRQLKIHYEDEGEPWIEARIQEFFGQIDTPRICRGRQPLLIKLLAPSRRPAQITQDLRGFWQGSYQEVKKELKRRYPKHAWPDDPLNYVPSAGLKPRS